MCKPVADEIILCSALDLFSSAAKLFGNVLLGKVVVYLAGACFFGGLVVPLLVVKNVKGLVQLAYLLLNGTALLFDKLLA